MFINQKGRCWWCSKQMRNNYHIDHRFALAQTGENDPSNLVLACAGCNIRKYTKTPMEFVGRLL